MDFINSQKECSGGLRHILGQRGIKDGIFALPIEEGPIFNIVKRLDPKALCVFHIGCSTDGREPSFEIKKRKGRLGGKDGFFEFRFERILPPDVVHNNEWFHDANGQRDLDRTSAALDNWRQCEETIRFVCGTSRDNTGMNATVILWFKEGKLEKIWDIDRLLTEPFISKLAGFRGSFLNDLISKIVGQKDGLRNPEDWNRFLAKENVTVENLIEQLYNLFLKSSAKLPKTDYCARF